ncbi:hypothetical protein HYALB_00008996 [Hymenoscyphus albidus]|uniref:Uncharacterized protein n=1 Tax=Hymenoscyphus albidus TaxID=595503 RepID=A0A9N9LRI4_9HELO|nr:hypothetical protein HYALB_00008996 [Hymenoscyphus albidus]
MGRTWNGPGVGHGIDWGRKNGKAWLKDIIWLHAQKLVKSSQPTSEILNSRLWTVLVLMILKEISEQLSAICIIGFNLKGIIYLRRITDNRMAGSEVRTLDFFQKLVGEEALPHVVLATTMLQKVVDFEEANDRDSELRDEYWGEMRRKGSSATRFEGTTDSAQGIVSQLLGKKPVVLKVQEQLVDQRMSLNQTEAGAFLEPKIGIDEEKFRKRLKELDIEIQTEKDANKRLQAKQSVRRNAAGLKKRMEDKETIK